VLLVLASSRAVSRQQSTQRAAVLGTTADTACAAAISSMRPRRPAPSWRWPAWHQWRCTWMAYVWQVVPTTALWHVLLLPRCQTPGLHVMVPLPGCLCLLWPLLLLAGARVMPAPRCRVVSRLLLCPAAGLASRSTGAGWSACPCGQLQCLPASLSLPGPPGFVLPRRLPRAGLPRAQCGASAALGQVLPEASCSAQATDCSRGAMDGVGVGVGISSGW
jgi:hypothetical protein